MRDILDPLDPDDFRSGFRDVFRRLQRGNALEHFACSTAIISCRSTARLLPLRQDPLPLVPAGTIAAAGHLLPSTAGGRPVHPDLKEVIPLAPEPIIQQDGQTKNDCERNATRRWLQRFRREHPHLPVIVVEDALAADAPHLKDLREARAISSSASSRATTPSCSSTCRPVTRPAVADRDRVRSGDGCPAHFRLGNAVPLNESHPDESVNVLEYWEIHPDGEVQHFSWITDFVLTPENVREIMRGGRARWEIENETFNTLKNQGYHLEHNYGHGEQNLSVVLALLMMLAFLVDQVQQMCCPLFQAAGRR